MHKNEKAGLKRIHESSLSHKAICVWTYLYYRTNKESTCFPAINTIASEVKLSASTVKRAITELTDSGYIKKEFRYTENGRQTSNLYTLKKIDYG